MDTIVREDHDEKAATYDFHNRQESFLKRKRVEADVGWRPRKLHRKSAFQWLSGVHQQMLQFVPTDGMLYYTGARAQEGPALTWPRLPCSPDQGPDGMYALHFWIHQLQGTRANEQPTRTFNISHVC